jgi:hypothetical protein
MIFLGYPQLWISLGINWFRIWLYISVPYSVIASRRKGTLCAYGRFAANECPTAPARLTNKETLKEYYFLKCRVSFSSSPERYDKNF